MGYLSRTYFFNVWTASGTIIILVLLKFTFQGIAVLTNSYLAVVLQIDHKFLALSFGFHSSLPHYTSNKSLELGSKSSNNI